MPYLDLCAFHGTALRVVYPAVHKDGDAGRFSTNDASTIRCHWRIRTPEGPHQVGRCLGLAVVSIV